MKLSKKILIIGGDSAIGDAVYKQLCAVEMFRGQVWKTTRRHYNLDRRTIRLDLAGSNFKSPALIGGFDIVLFCAGIGSIDFCEFNWDDSYRINVLNTVSLIEELKKIDARVIFISSTAVFDGLKEVYATADIPKPISNYGKQKKIVEDYIKCFNKIDIVRVPKVIHARMPLLINWNNSIGGQDNINAYCNRYLSPILLEKVAIVLKDLIMSDCRGLSHIVGDGTISYYDFAKKIFFDKYHHLILPAYDTRKYSNIFNTLC